jgi:hypothetical protein
MLNPFRREYPRAGYARPPLGPGAGASSSEEASPRLYQPGYVIPVESAGPPSQASSCAQTNQGSNDEICPGPTERPGVHQERPCLCDRCARARLRRNAWLVLLFWVPPPLIATAGVLRLALRVYREGNPAVPAYLPAVAALVLLSLGLLTVAGLMARMAWRQLRWARSGRWL